MAQDAADLIRSYRDEELPERLDLLGQLEDQLPDEQVLAFLCELLMDSGCSLDERLEVSEILKACEIEDSSTSVGLGRTLAKYVATKSRNPDPDGDDYLVTNHAAIALWRFPLDGGARKALESVVLDQMADIDLRFNAFESLFGTEFEQDLLILRELLSDPELSPENSREG